MPDLSSLHWRCKTPHWSHWRCVERCKARDGFKEEKSTSLASGAVGTAEGHRGVNSRPLFCSAPVGGNNEGRRTNRSKLRGLLCSRSAKWPTSFGPERQCRLGRSLPLGSRNWLEKWRIKSTKLKGSHCPPPLRLPRLPHKSPAGLGTQFALSEQSKWATVWPRRE